MKTIGIHKNEQGTCDFVVDIVNVDKAQYDKVLSETLRNRDLELQKEKEYLETIKSLKDLVKELYHEIAILKGEE